MLLHASENEYNIISLTVQPHCARSTVCGSLIVFSA